jgi:2-methylcitrate dehydratase PrpD
MSKEIGTQLARFVTETSYPEIPKETREFVKGLILKTTAGMLAGSSMTAGRKMGGIIRGRKLPEEVGVIGSGFKSSLWESVFANAFFSHASELEDDSFERGLFWDITVVPLIFSLAEKMRLSGREILEACVIGLEVHARTSLYRMDDKGLLFGAGAVGPAATVAKAMKLDLAKTTSAMGIAMSNVPMATLSFGTDAHYFESSCHCLTAMIAGEMAKEGMTGNFDIAKYLSDMIGKDKVDPALMVKDLGKEWVLHNIWIKKYPCCFLNHRAIDILLDLKKKHKLSYEDVESIELRISPGDESCNRPEPKTLGDLQFSFQHIMGCAMLDGDVNYKHIDPDILYDPAYVNARSKVKIVNDPSLSKYKLYMEALANVKITMKNGKIYSGERQYPIGSFKEPLTMDHFKSLYLKFTNKVLSKEQAEYTCQALLHLEELNDIQELMDIFTFRKRMSAK